MNIDTQAALIELVRHLGSDTAPAIIAATATYLQSRAIIGLVQCIIILPTTLYAGYRLFKLWMATQESTGELIEEKPLVFILSVASGLILFVLAFASFLSLLNETTWTRAFHPRESAIVYIIEQIKR